MDTPSTEQDTLYTEYDKAIRDYRDWLEIQQAVLEHPSVTLPDSVQKDPWKAGHGMFATSTLFEDWQREIEAYRQYCDARDGVERLK